MKILFADKFDAARIEALRSAGHECVFEPTLGPGEIPDHLDGVDVLVVRSTRVTAEAIGAGDDLSLIVRAGAGTNTIDCGAAAEAGVYVSNVPGRNAVAVAELTMGLLLAVDRRIVDNSLDLREGMWDKAQYTKADGLLGKTMAIIGLGSIGFAVAERASAFGLDVTALRRPQRSAAALERIDSIGIRLVATMDELLSTADIVSLHVPAGPETTQLVDKDFLAVLPDRAIVLNTSRGQVVDENALLEAIESKGLRAGLDVWDEEPDRSEASFRPQLMQHPNVVGTHHIGASTTQAQEAIADGTVELLERFAQGTVDNCVNMETEVLGTCVISVRHLDKVGVLAKILQVLRGNGINVNQMSNRIFLGSVAAVATIAVGQEPTPEALDELKAIDEVLGVSVNPLVNHEA